MSFNVKMQTKLPLRILACIFYACKQSEASNKSQEHVELLTYSKYNKFGNNVS
ncbi:hypothetical protein SAMN02745217_00378 [Anaerocolumna xylanovorans DSM 12503]|uniref:Uncharacterized protein n=1 Tax=Anaerocolumna xylanovorans DSM 12503 TaxID=1121345 RepID=A0A1M7XXY3_9FIRM|nr:hypothetical protein SAMN02745217_00378 [Anaerocolumna xylanovorans DSM 12503]